MRCTTSEDNYYYAGLRPLRSEVPRTRGLVRWCVGWSSYPSIRERLARAGGPILPEKIEEGWWFPDCLRGPLPYNLTFNVDQKTGESVVEFFPVEGRDGKLAGYLFRGTR